MFVILNTYYEYKKAQHVEVHICSRHSILNREIIQKYYSTGSIFKKKKKEKKKKERRNCWATSIEKMKLKDEVLSGFEHHCAGCYNSLCTGMTLVSLVQYYCTSIIEHYQIRNFEMIF
jgi:hypothetical protein